MANGDDLTRTLLTRTQALGHIRLAHGVVGKTSVVAGIALLVLGGIAWRIDAGLLLVIAGTVLLTFFAYLAAVLWSRTSIPSKPYWRVRKSSNIVSWSWRRAFSSCRVRPPQYRSNQRLMSRRSE